MLTIPHNKPSIGRKEIQAVARVIKSGYIAQGQEAKKFEDEFCKYMGAGPGHAIALSSGTAALYVALISLEIKPNDEVIIPTYVCSALLNAIYLSKAKPVLVDINCDNLNISLQETKKKINPKTKAIIVPHIFGMPSNVNEFVKLGLPVIEDCAQAIGSKLNNKPVGTFGKAAVFSFYATKFLTTGYGGMLFSKDKKIIKAALDYREFDCRKNYRERFNFQMSDIQAAIGRVQLKRINEFLKKRRKIGNEYYKILSPEIVWPQKNSKKGYNFYRFLIKVGNAKNLKKRLQNKGIKTIVPIETYELLHRYLGQDKNEFPVSEKIAKTTLSLPIFPSLGNAEIKKIKSALLKYLKSNKKNGI